MGVTNKELHYFPEQLIFDEILSRLPVKSLLRFKSVSKSWHHLIQSHKFTKFHLQHSHDSAPGQLATLFYDTSLHTLNFYPPNANECRAISLGNPSFLSYYKSSWNELGPPILVGSCNGLVCFAMPFDRYVVYNPSTRVFKELPKVTRTYCYGLRVFSLFAYDHVNDDYKVLELFQYSESYRCDNMMGVESLIFGMKSNSWKTIDTHVPYYKTSFVVTNDPSLRWVDRNVMVIRSFNLCTERYDEQTRPISASINGVREEIDLLISRTDDLLEFVLWTNTYCWTVLPAVCLKDGKKLNRVDLSDGDTTEVRNWDMSNKKGSLVTSKPWAESLVSLD